MPDTAKAISSRRGRPNSSRLAEMETAILDAARALFMKDGFDLVAMEAVAAEAGVSKTTLYARYPSKELLFDSVVRERLAHWSRVSSQQNDQLSDDIGERLKHHARVLALSVWEPEIRAFQRMLFATAERFPRLARSMYEVGYLYMVHYVRRDIEEAAVRDNKPVRDADGVARHFVGSIIGMTQNEGAGRELHPEEIVGAAVRSAEIVMAARDFW
jgi:TetR/AcrR family transcriptional regulator, mexJK operon transcriptional repressor